VTVRLTAQSGIEGVPWALMRPLVATSASAAKDEVEKSIVGVL
jgi:hypothetical protein